MTYSTVAEVARLVVCDTLSFGEGFPMVRGIVLTSCLLHPTDTPSNDTQSFCRRHVLLNASVFKTKLLFCKHFASLHPLFLVS